MAFKALVLDKDGDEVTRSVKELDESALPEGDVTVRVAYSDLNYKDGLILFNKAPLVRDYPHVPGIDFAGTVTESAHGDFTAGDEVVLTGWGVGERHWGGMAQIARVKGDWLVKLPEGLTTERAMALGTAGFTGMLCVLALEKQDVSPDKGPVVVTGATGGVGSVATAVLAKLGYEVHAVTGKSNEHDYLKDLGAKEIVDRAELAEPSKRPLEGARWAGGVDTVGGTILPRVFAQLQYGGSVAVCGNAAGPKLETTVLPLILRGNNLLGVDSVMCPMGRRKEAWHRLTQDLPMDKLDAMVTTVGLDGVADAATKILEGGVRGRTVIDVGA